MHYIGISSFDTANGPGVRVSLFVSGCTLRCPGCFNPESWDFAAGKPFTDQTQEEILQALSEDYVTGLSLLGGDPLEPANVETVTALCQAVRERFGASKTIWLWTGRRYEQVKHLPIFSLIDTVVDGPFVQKLKIETKGAWFGSSNQRVIAIASKTK